jgi:hypothetical protein
LPTFVHASQQIADFTRDCFGDFVDVLWFVADFEVFLADPLEVVLQAAASVETGDFRPVGRVVEFAKVGFDFAAENFKGGAFSDAVLTQQAQHKTRGWSWEPVEFEAVFAKSVAAVFFQLIRQIHDAYGFKRTFFDTDAASAAECFADDGFGAFNAYGFYVASYHWAKVYAELVAFFYFAFVFV